jgi:Tol biopolymer transport system component
LALSPDGSKVAFVRDHPGKSTNTSTLYVADTDGNRSLTLAGPVDDGISDVLWSPDGSTIAFAQGSCDAAGTARLGTIRADGTSRHTLAIRRNRDGVWLKPDAWSPDGSRLLYSTQDFTENSCRLGTEAGLGTLNSIRTDGSGRATLMRANELPASFAWSPDQRHIAYTFSDNSWCEIAISSANGTNARPLVRLAETDWCGQVGLSFVWSSDSRQIIFGTGNSVDVVSLTTGERRRIVGATRPTRCLLGRVNEYCGNDILSLSPDGERIAAVSEDDAKGYFSLYAVALTGHSRRRLPLPWAGWKLPPSTGGGPVAAITAIAVSLR